MALKKSMLSRGAWLTAVVAAAGLTACGGSDEGSSAPDPLQTYRAQTLQWGPCDSSILGSSSEGLEKLWERLGDRLQCSTMRAPMDWAQPERSDVFVAVMRLAAAEPAQRRGAMLFNPGGPGADGLGHALSLFIAFNGSNPASTQGALQLRLMASYDMVGFSPRGTGASTRLGCGTNELERFVDASPTELTDANLANAAYNNRKIAEACLRNPVTPYINTDATARDMDLLRGLLGEDKLNYVGYSYGTWLGGWYASLFPEKVGRMVLDSSQDYTGGHEEANLALIEARQRVHQEVLLPYAARHSNYFQLGASAADIDAMVLSLHPRMQGILGSALGGKTYSASDADTYALTLNAARGVDTLLKTLPDPSDDDAMEEALQQQVFISDDSQRDAAVRELALELYKDYYSTYLKREPSSIALEEATFWAVSCNDTPSTTSPTAWNDIVRRTTLRAPLFSNAEMGNPCVYWGGPRVNKPDVAAMQGLDVLMVQSQYDAATPIEGANRFFAQLPGARRVYVPGEYQHAVFPYTDTCVDTTVVRYLLGETPQERETTCQANPLEQDAAAQTAPPAKGTAPQAAQPKAAAKSARSAGAANPSLAPGDTVPPTYLHPEEAQKLIDSFKQGVGRKR